MNGRGVPQKRSRPSRAPTPSRPQETVEISSDDSDIARPQTKRHKSTTPLTNGASAIASPSSLDAKSANSGAQAAKNKSATNKESQPDRRNSSRVSQDVNETTTSPFKSYPPLSSHTQHERTVLSADASGIIKSTLAKPSPSLSQRPDSRPRHSRHTDSRSSSRSVVNSRVSTPDVLILDNHASASRLKMRDPKYFTSLEKTERTKSVHTNSQAATVPSDDENDAMSILERFQKPARADFSITDKPAKQESRANIPQSNVKVSVPIRPSPSPAKTQRTSVPPANGPLNFSLEVPLSQNEEQSSPSFAAKKKALFKELEQSADIAIERLPEVEKYFGQTGFSKAFDTTSDHERKMRAAPVYKRKVDTKKFFEETDFDELWKQMQLDAGMALEDVTKWNLEIKEEPNFDSDASSFDYDGDKLLDEIMDENFSRHPEPPLTFKNEINNRRIYGMFQFMGEYVIRDGVRVAPPSTNRGCNCEGQCLPETCACLHKQVPVDPFNPSNKLTVTKTIKTYYQSPKDHSITVLHPDYIANELKAENAHYEITECNEVCGCGPDCWNRVVGRGRTLSLEIYMTELCGFGVRYPRGDILKGQFIDVYLGEVITQQEVEKREDAKHPDAPSYVYSLDWFNTAPVYHVDGEYFGSPMRFVNHSCNPNARSFSVQTHQGDKHVYHLAFFAIRDIPAGEQITIDYCPQEAILDDDETDLAADSAAVTAGSASSISGQTSSDVVMSGAPSVEPEDEPRSTVGSRPSRSAKSSKSSRSGKLKGKGKAKANSAVPAVAPIVGEDGRSRCYCGAPNCRVWLWRAPGRRSRKRRNI